ncbi:MAG: LysE family translocator [Gammaproteobacteria bacterium]|nr:MAG: LysE family translocator [Gammaproteobacteria bacterium]
MSIESWLIFLSVTLIATLTPGPAILLATTHSIKYGVKKATITMFGNITGLLLMSILSVLGISAVILSSTVIFVAIKYLGAVYLIYMGIKLWRFGFIDLSNNAKTEKNHYTHSSLKQYSQGFFVALSNPKAIAFTTALFPQFIDHTRPLLVQFTILVITFMSLSFTCLFFYGFMAKRASNKLSLSLISKYASKIFAILFVVFGFALASIEQT